MRLKCAFCPKPADSGEHLWDAWICKLPPFQGKSYFREQILPNPTIREWRAVRLDRKKKTVCEKCNNEWMSDIVNDHAKPCIESMILSDARVELSPKCIASIAIFAFLKAVIGDHLAQDRQRFFSMAVRSKFRPFWPGGASTEGGWRRGAGAAYAGFACAALRLDLIHNVAGPARSLLPDLCRSRPRSAIGRHDLLEHRLGFMEERFHAPAGNTRVSVP